MGVLKLGAIDFYHGSFFAEQDFGGGFDDARLARACGPEKEQISDGAAGRVQAGTEHLINADNGLDGLVLSYDFGAKSSLEILNLGAAFRGIEYSGLNSHCALPKRPAFRGLLPKSVCALARGASLFLTLAHELRQ